MEFDKCYMCKTDSSSLEVVMIGQDFKVGLCPKCCQLAIGIIYMCSLGEQPLIPSDDSVMSSPPIYNARGALTNGECIRSMSDEEIATLLDKASRYDKEEGGYACGGCINESIRTCPTCDYNGGTMAWLTRGAPTDGR